jgi:Family of unknown function (DUF5996)
VRIATTPLINHWWNATLFVTARGLEAPAMHHAGGTFDVLFDLAGDRLVVQTSDGTGRGASAEALGFSRGFPRWRLVAYRPRAASVLDRRR